MALPAVGRARTNPWWPHLGKALEATAQIVGVAAQWPAPTSSPSLYRLLDQPLASHPTGQFGRHSSLTETCGECAWREATGMCQQTQQELSAATAACERFEPPFDCQDCGACCRAAYHSVTIAEGDVVALRHPDLIVHKESYSEIRREGDQCAALQLDSGGRYSCRIYQDRATCCREFENAGPHCVTARRRVGLSL